MTPSQGITGAGFATVIMITLQKGVHNSYQIYVYFIKI